MPTRKRFVPLDATLARAAKAAAKQRGMSLSAWLSEAVQCSLVIDDGLAAVAEWEAEHGSPTPEQIAVADAELDAIGVPRLRRES